MNKVEQIKNIMKSIAVPRRTGSEGEKTVRNTILSYFEKYKERERNHQHQTSRSSTFASRHIQGSLRCILQVLRLFCWQRTVSLLMFFNQPPD
jgi:hypothetical protein